MTTQPSWFLQAIETPCTQNTVSVAGTDINYLAWGEPGRQGLIFIHGGGAHAYWWAPVAAQFASEFRVLAVDLSGHGDSGSRETYALETWTDEVHAVAKAGEISGLPVVIGHSMGGFVAVATAARYASEVAGLIICDSPITEPDPEVTSYRLKEAFGNPRVYPSVEEAIKHFRTVPEQRNSLAYVMEYVARHSLREVDGGVQWKFDPQIFMQFTQSMRGIALPYMTDVTCRVALLRSQFGLVTPDIGESMFEALGEVTPVVELPTAGHHSMLDVPLILLTALRTLLADWQHSDPHRPRRAD